VIHFWNKYSHWNNYDLRLLYVFKITKWLLKEMALEYDWKMWSMYFPCKAYGTYGDRKSISTGAYYSQGMPTRTQFRTENNFVTVRVRGWGWDEQRIGRLGNQGWARKTVLYMKRINFIAKSEMPYQTLFCFSFCFFLLLIFTFFLIPHHSHVSLV